MRPHRRNRLSALTRGAALLGLGALASACSKSHPEYVNGPENPITTGTPSINAAAPSATADAGTGSGETTERAASSDAGLPRLPRLNAPPHPPYVNGPVPTATIPNKP